MKQHRHQTFVTELDVYGRRLTTLCDQGRKLMSAKHYASKIIEVCSFNQMNLSYLLGAYRQIIGIMGKAERRCNAENRDVVACSQNFNFLSPLRFAAQVRFLD